MIGKARRKALVVAMVLVPASLRGQSTEKTEKQPTLPCPRVVTLGSSAIIDEANPKFFVEVSEVSRRGTERVIHAALAPDSTKPTWNRQVCQSVAPEVDRNSKITIRIDQAYLIRTRFAGSFSVKGSLETSTGSRPIEIPGYSVIGKASELAPVSVGALSGLDVAIDEIRTEGKELARRLSDTSGLHEVRRDSVTQVAKHDSFARRASDVQRKLAEMLDTHASDSANAAAGDTAARKRLVPQSADIKSLQRALNTYEDSAKASDSAVARASQRTAQEFLIRAQTALRERSHARFALQELANPANRAVVSVYAKSTNRLPGAVIKLAGDADSIWTALLKPDIRRVTKADSLETLRAQVGAVRAILGDLVDATDEAKRTSLERTLAVSAMKDAEINVRATGADVGDRILLTFTDSIAGEPGSTRSMDVRIIVREFGVVRRVSDAVLLMNMPGMREGAEVAATQKALETASQGKTLTYPVNLRGGSAAGVTLNWTYLPRLDDPDGTMPYWARAIGAWLQPGMGLNAAVPSIAHKTITLAPGKTPAEEAKTPEVTYTAGAIITLFDSAVSWSVGRNLTGDKARTYTALGISFLAATEKAKQLFKDLNK